jgi:hypothetical protein
MKQFKNHPIYINYNLFTYDEREKSEEIWDRVERDRALDEISREKDTPITRAFENGVLKQLEIIGQTTIGKLLFKLMKPTEKVWILPGNNMRGRAVAATTPIHYKKEYGGGVRVYYDPDETNNPDHYYAADDLLFHELVHAYRAGRWSRTTWRPRPLREYLTEEEFLAVYLSNVYRAFRGELMFYRSHVNDGKMNTQEQIYDYLATDPEAFYALKYFTENDKFAMQVAKWAYPHFNPWRDFAELRKRFWNASSRFGHLDATRIDL